VQPAVTCAVCINVYNHVCKRVYTFTQNNYTKLLHTVTLKMSNLTGSTEHGGYMHELAYDYKHKLAMSLPYLPSDFKA
jgi:hypothetical protein